MESLHQPLSGRLIIDALHRSGVEYVLSVPDLSTSDGLLYPLSEDKRFKLIRVCKEDETIGIAAGMSYSGKRAIILVQNTGFLYSINAIRAVAVEYQLPICIMIGLLNKAPEDRPTQSNVYGVKIVEPILDVMGIYRDLIDDNSDIPRVEIAINKAYTASHPAALLLGRSPVAS